MSDGMGLLQPFALLSSVIVAYINDGYLRGATDDSHGSTETQLQ